MNIEWVIPCRYVDVHDNLGTIVGAGIDTYWLPDLPSPVQVLVAVRLTGMVDELGADNKHTLVNFVKDPGGVVIGDGKSEFAAEVQSARPEFLAGLLIPLGIQFEAAEEGSYAIEFVLDDGGMSTSLPVHVVHGLPPGVGPSAPHD